MRHEDDICCKNDLIKKSQKSNLIQLPKFMDSLDRNSTKVISIIRLSYENLALVIIKPLPPLECPAYLTASGETCQFPGYPRNPAYQDRKVTCIRTFHHPRQYELEILTTDIEEDVLGQAPENPS